MNTAHFITRDADGTCSLNLLVDGMHCPSCVAIIEGALLKQAEVRSARLNLSTRRLRVTWNGAASLGDSWVALIENMGYRAMPFDPATAETAEKKEEKTLLRCLAVAGFASGNLMLFSVPLWSSDSIEMGDGTRTLFHWVQAAIAIPAIAYCGMPFYRSAWRALRSWHTNMDVPISVAVILATLMSLFETVTRGAHSYFDSGVMLLFFLLIGRYLEARAKGRARSAAHDLLQMMTGFATVLQPDGTTETIPLADIREGMQLRITAGEKIGADCVILDGSSDIDTSLITGESLPRSATVGDALFAGTLNIAAPITVRVTKAGGQSLLAEIIRCMETAEQGQAAYVTLADRISGWYTPVVHALAAATFLGWWLWGGAAWQVALLYAATVLIITCPCALGLAVPVVQVLASGKLMRSGILLKSGSALERLARITDVVFDKTGTLTVGKLTLRETDHPSLPLAASLAVHSKHPLSQALQRAYTGALLPMTVREVQGCGLESDGIRLGKRSWATALPTSMQLLENVYASMVSPLASSPPEGERDVPLHIRGGTNSLDYPPPESFTKDSDSPPRGELASFTAGDTTEDFAAAPLPDHADTTPELWLAVAGQTPVRFTFADQLRADAAQVIATLQSARITPQLLSGDRPEVTRTIAQQVGITRYAGALTPVEKMHAIAALKASGADVLMVGDGLNDAPALAAASISMSPTSAIDIAQNAADIVFQGDRLQPVITAWRTAQFAQQLVRQNFALAILYNIIAIPLAVAGYVTPLIAAIAMSSSSLLVIANAMRLTLRKDNQRATHS